MGGVELCGGTCVDVGWECGGRGAGVGGWGFVGGGGGVGGCGYGRVCWEIRVSGDVWCVGVCCGGGVGWIWDRCSAG